MKYQINIHPKRVMDEVAAAASIETKQRHHAGAPVEEAMLVAEVALDDYKAVVEDSLLLAVNEVREALAHALRRSPGGGTSAPSSEICTIAVEAPADKQPLVALLQSEACGYAVAAVMHRWLEMTLPERAPAWRRVAEEAMGEIKRLGVYLTAPHRRCAGL